MNYKYKIVDLAGRMWARTLTRIRAVAIVKELREKKNLICKVEEIEGIK